ncbi:pyridoxal kinase [Sitophilus oryzae]|uniref:Pyridoxal kinase n=1 Tax=Sitophilus oryzae TaxID=7048 RepID=A0A6J2XQG0_SITOR|nr:pyridoxal kinase [Sitophilus oryzae]XP_030753616.1 pyridoxal kinase [Sitophilus oryzae]XP_030753617.1 pyridoxal kinase [Sitophilus oryzae]
MDSPKVLSIQSHVVSGYVGNKSAVFPMQLLGFDVDFINSVQFSNHTGYKFVKGQVLTEKELAELVTGLTENNIDSYSHLITGYIGSPSFLKEIANVYSKLKDKNPNIIYVCDPVLGDNGKLYVPQELIPLYQNLIVPIATVLTPNLFEIEILTNIKIENINDIWKAIDFLHEKGCETVCVSSAEFSTNENTLCVFGSSRKGNPVKVQIEIEKIPASFTGTGDLFSALLLCFMYQTESNLKESLEKTVAVVQAVLKKTLAYLEGKEMEPKNKELKLIQCKDEILNPPVIYRATIID